MKKLIYILFFALTSFGVFSQVTTRFVIKNDTHRDLYIQTIDLYENANGVSYFYVDYPNNPYPNPPLLHVPPGTALYYAVDAPLYQFPFPDEFPFQNNVLIGPGPVVSAPSTTLPLTDPSPNFFEYCKYYFDNWSNQDGFGNNLTPAQISSTDPYDNIFFPVIEQKYHNGTNIQYEVRYRVDVITPTDYIINLEWVNM